MSVSTGEKIETLNVCFGTYPHTKALKEGKIKSDRVALQFTEINPVNRAFMPMAREQKFDISEMAIVTYLQAKAYNKPLVLMPATMMGRFQHGTMLYNSERGTLRPEDLPGKRVGVRAFSQTTGVWIRGILWKDYGLDLGTVKWVTFEDAHVAEYRDPPGVERAAAGKDITKMLLDGELDAAIFGGAMPSEPQLKSVIPDPEAAAKEWYKKNGAVPVNHMVVLKESLAKSSPGIVREVYRLLLASKQAAGLAEAGRDRSHTVRFRCGKAIARTHERLCLRDEAYAAPLFGRGIVRRHHARAASLTKVAATAARFVRSIRAMPVVRFAPRAGTHQRRDAS